MSKATIKKMLQSMPKDEIIGMVLEMYDARKEAKEYLEFYANPDEDGKLEEYKKIITEEFYPSKGRQEPKTRFAICRKAVSDYKKLKPSADKLADLMLCYVENACQFTYDYGEMWEQYYTSVENNSDSKLGKVPVYVPNLMDSSSKLLDEVMMNRILHEAIPELPNDIKKVIVYYVDITSEEEIYKFINEDKSVPKDFVELRDLKVVLDDVVAEDYAEYKVERATEELCGQKIEKEGFDIEITKFVSDRVLQKINDFNAKNMGADKKKKFNPISISNEGLETIEYLSVDCTATEGEWHSDAEVKIDKLGYVILNGQKTKNFWDARIYAPKQPLRLKIRNICGDETIFILSQKSQMVANEYTNFI